MTALVSLLVVLTVSLLITRIATVALTLTGLSRETARFQARSAFTGSGFTTSESELVVRHPVRRRIVMLLMLLGNAGIVAVVGSFLLAFIEVDQPGQWLPRLVVLGIGIVIVWGLATSRSIDRIISRVTTWALTKYTQLDVRDYSELLHLGGEYKVVELEVRSGDWLADKSLAELNLRREGMMVLAIRRSDGTFLGVPTTSTVVDAGDVLVLYGRTPALANLDRRGAGTAGERARERAVAEQRSVAGQQEREDQARADDDSAAARGTD